MISGQILNHQSEPRDRLHALRRLLETGTASTQEELRAHLVDMGFDATQSTISRSLRKLGAVKGVDEKGRTVYRISHEAPIPSPVQTSLRDLVSEIVSNGNLIVVRTPPGSASLVARHLDHSRPGNILGTIAGDDTIFIAPSDVSQIPQTIEAIWNSFLAG